jgi:hypothetical protein
MINHIVAVITTLITVGSSHQLPFHSWEPRFKTNSEKYRAILLGFNFEDDPLETWESRRSFHAHFLMRTSATPLGPGLNSGSFAGIIDQEMPLVGFDLIQAASPRGYWPLFSTPSAALYVDKSSSRWVNVYSSSGSQDSVMCDMGEAIIGIRYSSHKNAAQYAPGQPVAEIPDIQCARLLPVAQVKAVDLNSVDKKDVKMDSTGGATITTVQSVMNVKQCMLDQTSELRVTDRGATMNTCASRVGPTTVSGNVLLLEYLLSLRPDFSSKHQNPDSPLLLDFLVRSEKPITSEDLFGTDDFKADADLRSSISQAKDTAVNKAQAQYQANWGATVDVQSVIDELGDKPWSSEKLVAGSAEFVTGSLTSGSPMQLIRGFAKSEDSTFPVAMVCGSVIGCAHGACKDNKCVCDAGFSGGACTERLDPCGSSPCGTRGRCSENFNSTDPSLLFSCKCDEGFSGEKCDRSSDPCLQLRDGLWQHVDCGQGSCVPKNSTQTTITGSPNAYLCSCNPGYDLDSKGTCSVRKVDCVGQWSALALCDSSCLQTEVFKISRAAEGSGAQCSNIEGDSRKSICVGGNCKQCMSRDCNGKGRCDDAQGKCVCQSGFKGDNCEQSTDMCSSTLCNGHGNCNELQTACTCVNGWKSQTGAATTFCDVDPCAGCPPGNCNLLTGTCACPDELPAGQWPACSGVTDCQGHWGPWSVCSTTCERKRYFTIDVPASNGGSSCPNKVGEFTTEKCMSGACCTLSAGDCQNGADYDQPTCTCKCKPGFQGDKCEYKADTADAVVRKQLAVDATTMSLFNTTERPDVNVPQPMQAADTAATPDSNKLTIYIAVGAGGLLLIGGLVYYLLKKKPAAVPAASEDPLLAGMEGMDLTGMDLSALGIDPNVNPL